jgi:hypothetical protein
VTLKSPPSVVIDVQAEKFPDSKLSAKIRSLSGVLVDVAVAVLVGVDVVVEV